MGNCIRKEPPTEWAGEDWGYSASETLISGDDKAAKKIEEDQRSVSPSSTEVKIKITKKQLEELLGRMELHGMSAEEVLNQLMNDGDHQNETHQRSWRPSLKSIPEID